MICVDRPTILHALHLFHHERPPPPCSHFLSQSLWMPFLLCSLGWSSFHSSLSLFFFLGRCLWMVVSPRISTRLPSSISWLFPTIPIPLSVLHRSVHGLLSLPRRGWCRTTVVRVDASLMVRWFVVAKLGSLPSRSTCTCARHDRGRRWTWTWSDWWDRRSEPRGR